MPLLEKIEKEVTTSQVWKSMFRNWPWQETPRHRARHIVDNVWLHLHPAKLNPRAVKWTFTSGPSLSPSPSVSGLSGWVP